jgi:N,N'-diacetyllegionaminate synthase
VVRIIAEIGSVHDGSFGNACRLIEKAAECGADAVKFQTHIPEAESLPNAPSPAYFNAEPRMEYFRRTAFTKDQWKKLKDKAIECKVSFLSSPFSLDAVDLLEEIGIEVYKVPSGEVTNTPLLQYIAQTKKPVLLSSGMSNWKELDTAVALFKGKNPLTVMQCSSVYPCPPEKVGLNVISEMAKRYQTSVGFSDHTLGVAAAIAAAAMGATVIEKHFTFSRSMYGSDAKHSMEPVEFKVLTQALKETWQMLEHPVDKNDLTAFQDMKLIFQKSIVTASALPEGTVLTKDHLAFKKPGDGIMASDVASVLGRRIARALPKDHKLHQEDLH